MQIVANNAFSEEFFKTQQAFCFEVVFFEYT